MTNFKDERIEQAKNKIYSELMLIIFYIIAISFVVKSLYFRMELKQCMTEYIILILSPVYQMVRSRQMGVVLNANAKKTGWKAMIPAVLVLLLCLGLLWMRDGNVPTGARAASVFLSLAVFAVFFLILQRVFLHSEQKRAEKLEHKFDDKD